MPVQTRWGAVLVLILAGVITALQVGKAAIAVPILQRELALTLVAASWIVGAYGVLGATAGLPARILSSLLRPSGVSTPECVSTAQGRTSSIARVTFSGFNPPARITGLRP